MDAAAAQQIAERHAVGLVDDLRDIRRIGVDHLGQLVECEVLLTDDVRVGQHLLDTANECLTLFVVQTALAVGLPLLLFYCLDAHHLDILLIEAAVTLPQLAVLLPQQQGGNDDDVIDVP